MLVRAANRAETTLLSSRQALPRPARLYSTPTKRASAPALATAPMSNSDILPPHLYTSMPSNNAMEQYLRQRANLTFLPAMRPSESDSMVNMEWYGDTETQDQLAMMSTCLHALYDVSRAENILENLRQSRGRALLDVQVFNAFIDAYLALLAKEPDSADIWLDKLWEMYGSMEQNAEGVEPSHRTYALVLASLLRTPEDLKDICPFTVRDILVKIDERKLSVSDIVADSAISTSEDASQLIKELSSAAVQLNMRYIVAELGQTEAIGSTDPDILDDVAQVTPVLKTVKKTLEDGQEETTTEVPFNIDNLRKHLTQVTLSRRVLSDDLISRQKILEESVYDVAVERLKHETEAMEELGLTSSFGKDKDLRQWMWDWHTKLRERLEQEVVIIRKAEDKKRFGRGKIKDFLSQYLVLVSPERLSLITILEVMRMQGSGGVHEGMKTTRLLITLGRAVEMEYRAQMCRKNHIELPTLNSSGEIGYFSGLGYKNLLERRVVAARHIMDSESWTTPWTQHTRAQVGGLLIDCLTSVAKIVRSAEDKNTGQIIKEEHPAFYHTYEFSRGHKLGVVRLNTVLAEAMARDNLHTALHPRHLPMLVQPRPWTGPTSGGYLRNRSTAMRYKDSVEQASYLSHASELGNIELIYAGLNVLGATPWVINKKIFDVVLEVWNSGKGIGKLPPAVLDMPEPVLSADATPKDRAFYIYQIRNYLTEKSNNHSQRCNVNYKIEIARTFLGETIYQPHNLDFRGRAYPIPPHLNHIGDDLSRGLMKFAEAKPLGERGLRWLKIHLANLYGYDKANFEERVQFVEDRLDDIFDSALNPLTGKRWWLDADDPWQCLATCFELHAALSSPDPLQFMSSQPVHQDGTCNGLQHYAALGGDSRGAQQVNLSAGERPSDVYTYVANMVEEQIKKDIEKDDPNAKILAGKVSRKLVKQTVMTTVYGVTYIGAREQIEKQIKASDVFRNDNHWALSAYLARVVLSSIGDLFSGAKDIQNWLTLCARLISKAIPGDRLQEALDEYNRSTKAKSGVLPLDKLRKEQLTSVVWTTPLGLPIVQPYRKTKRKQVMTKLQSVYISDPNLTSEVNSMKQASAFPPNFVHSLDATHMLLSALECQTQGLTFAAVHDSYWTHASSIDQMSAIIRDTFIALHSSDVLGKLREEFIERYRNYKIPLGDLKTESLLKAFKASGVSFKPIQDQIVGMHDVAPIIDDGPVTEEEKDKLFQDLRDELATVNMDTDDLNDDESLPKTKKKEEVVDPSDELLLGKFVNLIDLLPPVPKKGDFRVEAIKASQYFFS